MLLKYGYEQREKLFTIFVIHQSLHWTIFLMFALELTKKKNNSKKCVTIKTILSIWKNTLKRLNRETIIANGVLCLPGGQWYITLRLNKMTNHSVMFNLG